MARLGEDNDCRQLDMAGLIRSKEGPPAGGRACGVGCGGDNNSANEP